MALSGGAFAGRIIYSRVRPLPIQILGAFLCGQPGRDAHDPRRDQRSQFFKWQADLTGVNPRRSVLGGRDNKSTIVAESSVINRSAMAAEGKEGAPGTHFPPPDPC